ncbi:hypothetical protein FHS16_005597 [Paenibacillus endophyticus]|uniref:Uncharacterized protein n=1 Tax=Paenibacillus endophyticus TaxID=1294268 RepID=A0A7W5CE04_9BACL|nr:hypothetical protein [Paenibacillus endophyticus]MBB3155489.1 hypothetical protein [Paenibacillus endophyticus]
MRKSLRRIEWTLLVIIGGIALMFVIPSLDLFDRDQAVSEAKKAGHYYKVNADTQTYFGKKLRVDGVIYDEDKLVVYLSSKDLFVVPSLPNSIQVKTDSGLVLDYNSSSGSMRLFKARGDFIFDPVPEDMKSITVFNEAYGHSFSFPVSFEGGGDGE